MTTQTQKRLLKQAKGLDFTSIHDLYDYVIESKINGNPTQVKSLIKDMPKEGRKDFYRFAAAQRNTDALFCAEVALSML